MNLIELKVTRQALRQQLETYERVFPCCKSCERYEHNLCTHFGSAPPPEWVSGEVECPEWQYDFAPF